MVKQHNRHWWQSWVQAIWDSPRIFAGLLTGLLVIFAVVLESYNLAYNPDTGLHNDWLSARVTNLSNRTRRSGYSSAELKRIFGQIKMRMTDRQVLRIARANGVKLVKRHSPTGEWVYTTKDRQKQVYVAFNDGRVVNKTYNTNDYTAEVRRVCGDGCQKQVLENGQVINLERRLSLP